MMVGPRRIAMLAEPEAKALPWEELGIDVVIESTGQVHQAGRRQRRISMPGRPAS